MPIIENPEVYVVTDRIFYENSQQLDLFAEEIEKELLPAIKNKNHFLDIGAGPGLLTKRLASHFQTTSVVEPNNEFVKKYEKGAFQVYNSTFEECSLPFSYDFVLCSHVLYHIDLKKWPAFLDKLYKSINANGKGLVIMMAPRGRFHEECLKLNPEYPHSKQGIEYLQSHKIPHKIKKVKVSLKTRSFQDMFTVLRFFLFEDCFTPETYKALTPERLKEIDAAITQFVNDCLTGESTYELQYDEDHILIDGLQIDKQYDTFAEEYSDIFVDRNPESISTYFRHLDMPMEGKKVCDLGCGDGYDLSRIKQNGALIFGIDGSQEMVRLAKEKNPEADIKLGHFDNIPFADNSFDLVVSKWAFQNYASIDPIYKEIVRVLKPGGSLVFLTSHPIRQFIEKKRTGKDYFKKEMVNSVFFDGLVSEIAPSHTLNEYLSPTFCKHFALEAYEEGNDSGAERVDGDIFPSFFVVKAMKKS